MKPDTQKTYLAVEFAGSGLKFVKMTRSGGHFKLTEIKILDFGASQTKSGVSDQALEDAVRSLLSREQLADQTLLLGINHRETCFKEYTLPKIPRREVEQALKWKMKEDLPYPPEEAVIHFRVSEGGEHEGKGQLTCFAAAVPAEPVNRLARVLSNVGVPSCISSNAVFSYSSLPQSIPAARGETVAVVDLGHTMTEVTLYRDGKVVFLRKLAFSAAALANVLRQPIQTERGRLSLSEEEANLAMKSEDIIRLSNPKLVAGKIESSHLHALARPELEKLADELKRSFDYYHHEKDEAVKRAFLTGGLAQLKGLGAFLSERLVLPVELVHLAKDVEVPPLYQRVDLSPYFRLIAMICDQTKVEQTFLANVFQSLERTVRPLSYPTVTVLSVILIAGFFAGLLWQGNRLEAKAESVKKQIRNLEIGFESAAEIRKVETEVKRGKAFIERLLILEPDWESVFREVSGAVSEDIVVHEMNYEHHKLVFEGELAAREGMDVSSFLFALEGPVFRNVQLLGSAKGADTVHFSIECDLGST